MSKDINSEIVNSISASGGKAIGISGNDNLITARKLNVELKDSDSNIEKIVDIGFVGEPKSLNKNILEDFIKKDQIPVISPLGKDEENFTYNINADTVAGFVAGELKASKLLLLTDVPGIFNEEKKLISSLTLKEAIEISGMDYISGGMKPKIQTCIDAMEKGVSKSTILDGRIPHSVILELFTEHGIGTQISNN